MNSRQACTPIRCSLLSNPNPVIVSKTTTRSPLKDKPLRLPGQSVEEERERVIENNVVQPMMLALFMGLVALLEWWRTYTNMKPSPVVFSIAALGAIAYAAIRFWRSVPALRNLRQALEGERAVGQFLERLRESGYHVFHDVVGTGFNVDHVLIGPAGVFTVETKTWSKPVRGSARVVFDGESLTVAGSSPDRDPVVQGKAQAGWVRSMLSESTGREFSVRPVIVFPGWYVENVKGSFKNVWVLEPKALPTFLNNEQRRMTPEDIKLASYHLSRLIRVSQAKS